MKVKINNNKILIPEKIRMLGTLIDPKGVEYQIIIKENIVLKKGERIKLTIKL